MCGAKTLYISQQSISVHLQQEKLCECRSIVVVRENSTTVQIRDTMRTDGVKESIQNCANKREMNQYKFVHCRLGKGYKKNKCKTKLKQFGYLWHGISGLIRQNNFSQLCHNKMSPVSCFIISICLSIPAFQGPVPEYSKKVLLRATYLTAF